MIDKSQSYWEKALKKYSEKDWINQPTIFVQEIKQYFPTGCKILELAAGQGQDSRYLAKNGFQVVCTDRSDYGLKESANKTKTENLHIIFQKVDLSQKLPFANQEFDVVYSHLGLHYFSKENTKTLFEEIHRVLKPSGIFAALFNTINDPEIHEKSFKKIEDNYYLELETGLKKRYFDENELKYFTEGLFEPIILDEQGRAYKDEKTALVRFLGKSI